MVAADGFEEATASCPDAGPSPEAVVLHRDDYARVAAAMAELPERTRIALEMHRFGGAKLREIAAFLGISLPLAEHLASAWVDHTFPGRGAFGDVTVGVGLRYVGETWGDTANTVKVDGYAIADAALGYRITDNVSLQLNVTNLFDKEYVSANYFGSVYYGDRRMVLATFKYTW